MPISEYDTRVLQRAVELIPKPASFLRDVFFPNVELSTSSEIDVDKVVGTRRTSVYVTRSAEATVIDKTGYTTSKYTPPLINQKTPIELEDVQKRLPGELLYSQRSAQSRRDELEIKIITDLEGMITRAEELQSTQAILTGTVTVTNGDTISYGRTAGNTKGLLGAARRWDQTTAKPLADFDDWKKTMLQNGKCQPTHILMDSESFYLLVTHANVRELLDTKNYNFGMIGNTPSTEYPGACYRGYLNGYGEIWTYDDTYISSGSETAFITTKIVAMLNQRQLIGTRHYGVLEAVVTGSDGRDKYGLVEAQRYYDRIHKHDPVKEFIRVQSAPLIACHNPDAVVTAQVIA